MITFLSCDWVVLLEQRWNVTMSSRFIFKDVVFHSRDLKYFSRQNSVTWLIFSFAIGSCCLNNAEMSQCAQGLSTKMTFFTRDTRNKFSRQILSRDHLSRSWLDLAAEMSQCVQGKRLEQQWLLEVLGVGTHVLECSFTAYYCFTLPLFNNVV